eukprot:scaffold3073_cov66-Cylindrotheca_fusiformis.AAC.7
MKLSFAILFASLLLRSQEVRSQSVSLRGGGGGNATVGSSSSSQQINAVRKQSSGFAEGTATSSHRSLPTSYWEGVDSFEKSAESRYGGQIVSISGDGSILAAAPQIYSADRGVGTVRFFQKQESGGKWAEIENLRLLRVTDDFYFGSDISLSGSGQRVAIGANGVVGSNDDGSKAGIVSVYERSDGSQWELLGIIHGESANDNSGFSVALSKDGLTLAIGSNLNNSGHVRVYRWDAGTSSFVEMGDGIRGEAKNEQCGFSVDLSEDGSVLAIGAPYAKTSTGDSNVGKVRVFDWDLDENIDKVPRSLGRWEISRGREQAWEQIGQALTGGTRFGTSVSLSTPPSSDSTILAVGSYTTGHTYKLVNNDQWEELGGVLAGAQQVSLVSNGKSLATGNYLGDGDVAVYNAIDRTIDH